MYCPKCKFTSFDHLSKCPKCGRDWDDERKVLNLDWLVPTHRSPAKESGETASAGEFSFSSSRESRQSDNQSMMHSSDFLDLADSEESDELVYDLSDSPPDQPSGQSARADADQKADRNRQAAPEEPAEDDIVLDFDSFDLDEDSKPADPNAGASAQADEEESLDDGFADLQLEDESAAAGKTSGKTAAAPQSQDGDEIGELLEDEELELDDILVELDAEDEKAQGKQAGGRSGASS